MAQELDLLAEGSSGVKVLDIQAKLVALGYSVAMSERGVFGPQTTSAVKAFQVRRGLIADGIVGSETWRELIEAGWVLGVRLLYLSLPAKRGDDVRELQGRLNSLGFDAGKADGVFGAETAEGIREFQVQSGLLSDGICGRETVGALERLSRRILPGSKSELRQRLAREGSGIHGSRVFLDPGHGAHDVGTLTPTGVPEAYVVFRVAEAAAAKLSRLGAHPELSRTVQEGPAAGSRARHANDLSSDVAISLHLACRTDPGPAVAFWSVERTQSHMGRDLAMSIGDALAPRWGRAANVVGRNLPFLRGTKMPAVSVDLGCKSTDSLLDQDAFLVGLGGAIANGVKGYFKS